MVFCRHWCNKWFSELIIWCLICFSSGVSYWRYIQRSIGMSSQTGQYVCLIKWPLVCMPCWWVAFLILLQKALISCCCCSASALAHWHFADLAVTSLAGLAASLRKSKLIHPILVASLFWYWLCDMYLWVFGSQSWRGDAGWSGSVWFTAISQRRIGSINRHVC